MTNFDLSPADLRRWGAHGLVALAVILIATGAFTKNGGLIFAGLVSALGAVAVYKENRDLNAAQPPLSTTPASDAERQRNLQNYLASYVSKQNARVESPTQYAAVVVVGQKVNHVLHLLISLFLCGIWLPVWLLIGVTGGEKRIYLSVDDCGNVTAR